MQGLLRSYMFPQLRRVAVLGLCLLAAAGVQLLVPQFLKRFIDAVLDGSTTSALLRVALVFLAVAVGGQSIGIVSAYLGTLVSWTGTNSLRADLADHCLHLDMSFHTAHTPGEMIERIDGDVATLANFVSAFVVRLVSSLILLVGTLLILMLTDLLAGLIITGYSIVTLTVMYFLRGYAQRQWRSSLGASAEFFGIAEEALTAKEDMVSSRALTYLWRRLTQISRKWRRTRIQAGFRMGFMRGLSRLLVMVGRCAGMLVGGYLYLKGDFSLGTAYAVYYYVFQLSGPFDIIIAQIEDFQRAAAGATRVRELFSARSRIVDVGTRSLPGGRLDLRFRGVSFAYGQEPALRNVSFSLEPGCCMGLLGRTGSGKTTLSRLLFRLYEQQQGAIEIGGMPIRACSLSDLRSRVGLVTQEVQLFAATLRENLTMFREGISDTRIERALGSLGLGPWLERQHNGLDSLVASAEMSAGEAQLMAFARLLIHKEPGLVILDEATSRVDPATEMLIDRAVQSLRRRCTMMIIAHRLETVRRADTIMVLEGGRVVELGSREILEADDFSMYSALLRTGSTESLA